jgi:hypothetical protein
MLAKHLPRYMMWQSSYSVPLPVSFLALCSDLSFPSTTKMNVCVKGMAKHGELVGHWLCPTAYCPPSPLHTTKTHFKAMKLRGWQFKHGGLGGGVSFGQHQGSQCLIDNM